MLYNDVIIEILKQNKELKTPPSQSDIAKILGVTRQTICNRANDKIDFDSVELFKIFESYNVNVQMLDTPEHSKIIPNIIRSDSSICPYRMEHKCPCKEQFEIHYLECLPEEVRLSEVTSVHKDAQIVKEHWHREAENLRILPMQGDGLTTYWYPCLNRDILIIDINSTVPTREGLYAYSAKDNTMFFVAKLSQMMDGTIKIEKFEATGKVVEKLVSPEKQKEVDFRVLGRIVNNESLSL